MILENTDGIEKELGNGNCFLGGITTDDKFKTYH